MKLFKYSPYLACATVFMLVSAGCAKQLDINTNPNAAVTANIDPYLVFPGALSNTASNINTGYGFLFRWMGFIATAAGVAPSTEEESYNISTTFNTAAFTTPLDINEDLQFIENVGKTKGQTFYVGAAKIIKALNFARIVDAYNSIPYSQALQGLTYITPKYDDPKAIYEDLLKQIDTGMVYIKGYDLAANPNAKTVDIMFAADKTQWAKFGNTLKLRLLMHQANRADRQDYIKTEMAKIVAEGSGFLETGKTASVNPGYSQSQPNPYYSSYGFTMAGQDPTSSRANNTLLNFLKIDSDPRVAYDYKAIATALPAGAAEPTPTLDPKNYRGNDYGLATDNSVHKYQTANYVSRVGGITAAGASASANTGIIKGWDMRAWIITSIESLFLQAEAIQRGYLAGNAETAYKAAVQESFIWLNVGGSSTTAATQFNTWYTGATGKSYQANVVWTAATDKLKLIAYQKYLALVPLDGLETWTDYRRNGNFPVIQLSQSAGRTSLVIPVRLLYPSTELSYNLANVPQTGRLAGSQFTDKIWWMP
ncbi:MAG: SusD/RagB family nutrient-binding outer membrane lipoprotein [Williamsia sp.]|nr:SusD/RagB family nutrient-binding outer membrane lipoprotein [Williamsia sp.]